jgi:hypothetical protein
VEDAEFKTKPAAMEIPDRWTLIRDIVVLQFKLVLDGIRDFVLVPVSLVTGAYSLLKGGRRPGSEFYDLLRYGRQSDRVINLFGAADRVHDPLDDGQPLPDIDELVARMESFVVDEYKRGGMTAQAKQRVDQLLDAVNRHAAARASTTDDA